MNHWAFILGAYAITLAAVLTLTGWSWSAMRRAEADAAKFGRDA
ncbi:MAG: heme exporter protein CcmD [Sphingosinicella sp.]